MKINRKTKWILFIIIIISIWIINHKEELQKLLEEIKPYYNKNEYIITFSSKKGEDIW